MSDDPEVGGTCYVCGHGLRYGERHHKCGAAMLPLEGQIKCLSAALVDTLDFVERHSNRWDGVNGKHPMAVVTAAREALALASTTAPQE